MARLVGEDATATPNVFFSPGRRYWFGKADLCVLRSPYCVRVGDI